jgi:hypothetical protein
VFLGEEGKLKVAAWKIPLSSILPRRGGRKILGPDPPFRWDLKFGRDFE